MLSATKERYRRRRMWDRRREWRSGGGRDVTVRQWRIRSATEVRYRWRRRRARRQRKCRRRLLQHGRDRESGC